MHESEIVIRGAREHNLRDVNLKLPRNQLIVMTGVSGSGKSSLAFDTLYAEGQRRYVESLSSYARQFLGQMPKPDVDLITGLAPSISIQQKTSGRNPRSTVGTITEIYDYLRVLFARVGQGFCPKCDRPITAQTREQILDSLGTLPPGTRFQILAPLIQRQKGEYRDLFDDLLKQGFLRARVDGKVVSLTDNLQLDRQMRHTIEVLVDRLQAGHVTRARLAEAVETALRMGNGSLIVSQEPDGPQPAASAPPVDRPAARSARRKRGRADRDEEEIPDLPAGAVADPNDPDGDDETDADFTPRLSAHDKLYSARYACTHCSISYEPPSPQLFSFNSPQGMCPDCTGLGVRHDFDLAALIPDDSLSFRKGAIPLIGSFKELGRWRRHIFEGVARVLEADFGLEPDSILSKPWKKLPDEVRQQLLYGTGSRNITFAWRHRGGVWKHGGTYPGVIPELLEAYRKANNPMRRRQLEKHMRIVGCTSCAGTRLNPQARAVRLKTTSDNFLRDQQQRAADAHAHDEQRVASTAKPEKRTQRGTPRKTSTKKAAAKGAASSSAQASSSTATPAALDVKTSLSLTDVCGLTIAEAAQFFEALDLDATGQIIAGEVLKEIRGRLGFLLRCGLDYLTLERTAPTLSGGESQRIRLAGQIGCGLVGVVYILDEPSIGLHPRDNGMLLRSLLDLRDLGNTVIVVEHDEDTILAADHVVDFGPGPGVRGGEVVAEGRLLDVVQEPRSLTGQYLSGAARIEIPKERRPRSDKQLTIVGARHNNLRNLTVEIPLQGFVCVTGVSGSGKSSLINDILWEALSRDLNGAIGNPGAFEAIRGLEHIDKVINIDQSPIGRTPRSNPATYVKLFDLVRDLYTQLPESKRRGYKAGRFSFNVPSGRCEACEGHGSNRLEMDFLADIWVTCPVCGGHRFNHETLEVHFKGASIADVLEMDVQQALSHFENIPKVLKLLKTLHDVGLDYLKLGQPSPTLSGGEAQRIKLARELGKRSTGRTVYILDEPTTGLHFADIHKLLDVLHGFVSSGNTVLVVEHNLDVIKTADWVIDLGPEGGAGGGRVIVQGTPEQVAACPESHTGRALAKVLHSHYTPLGSLTAVSPTIESGHLNGGGTNGHAANGSPNGAGAKPRGRKSTGKTAASTALTTQTAPILASAARVLPADSAHAATAAAASASHTNGVARPIVVRGAAQHNLQQLDVEIPRHRLSVFCGPSGSGKSSLAMDTLYAEGQRRYVESLSSYARQFLGQMPKPRVEHISGLSPAIAIEQKTVGHSPRSTVGTVTEIYDYLRVLFARLGTAYCPACDIPVQTQATDEVIAKILALPVGTRVLLAAPQEVAVGDSYDKLWDKMRGQGFRRVRIDGTTYRLEEVPEFDRRRKHDVEIIVDRITIGKESRSRIGDSVESALDLGKGWMHVVHVHDEHAESDWHVDQFSLHKACTGCGRSFEELTPNNFSFNSSLGWCPSCEGLGVQQGTNLAALVADPKRTLRTGAIAAWPDVTKNALFSQILAAMSRQFGLPLDMPFERLDARHQRLVLFGSGDKWITIDENGLKVQYKGLYPAVEEATRVSTAYRLRLDYLTGEVACSACQGSRLRSDSAAVRFHGQTLQQLVQMPLRECLQFFEQIPLHKSERKVAGDLLREVTNRLSFLVDVGLHYLTLGRTMPTLSGGESQRIRLAGQVGRALTGVLYVLDEPTIGLHPRDNSRLLQALQQLRDLGNTVILVEHDREVLEAADCLYDFGPGAGRFGGTIVGSGTSRELGKQPDSLTGQYLSGTTEIPIPATRRMSPIRASASAQAASAEAAANAAAQRATAPVRVEGPRKSVRGKASPGKTSPDERSAMLASPTTSPTPSCTPPGGGWLEIRGARHHNLRDVDLRLPLGTLTCITGVSGSGKSSLVEETLAKAVARRLHNSREAAGAFDEILGLERVNKVIQVDQNPLGTTPASNPATYTGVFDLIRDLYTRLPDAKIRGYRAARFSFNRAGGRCEDCEGNGQKCIEMHFLPDVWVECETCRGRRFNEETLAVKFRGKSIADVLEMSIGQALELFENVPKVRGILATLCAVGLDYLTLGQSAATLSGGEAQRVKLAAELARPQTGKTLYILDEPTTGLHFDDIRKLLKVLDSLVERGNTVVVIEHNLDVIKTADWIIDLGPEAGYEGGWIVAEGTPEDVVEHAQTWLALHPDASPSGIAAASKKRGQRRTAATKSAPRSTAPSSHTGTETGDSAPSAQAIAALQSANPGQLRSYTGELLAPLLATGTRRERDIFDAAAAARKRTGDVDLRQVGRGAKMPWQTDGRKWHCVDRIGHNGRPCRWEGAALELVVDALAQFEGLSTVNWNDRSVVELTGTSAASWFLHALTGDEWLLTLKFRVPRKTFQEDQLRPALGLRSLDDLDELPVYGRGDRVRLKNTGIWQEITITVHWLREIDTPAFQQFLKTAAEAYLGRIKPDKLDLNTLTPWKTLGKRWHLSRKGFPTDQTPLWEPEVIHELVDALQGVAEELEVDWTNQQVVHVRPAQNGTVWAAVHTKRRGGVDLSLFQPAGTVQLGRIATFGSERQIVPAENGRDEIKLRFTTVEQVTNPDFAHFLTLSLPPT